VLETEREILEPGTRRIIMIGDDGSVQQLSNAASRWSLAVLVDTAELDGRFGADAGARPGAFVVPAARSEFVCYPSINFHVVQLSGLSFPEVTAD
jgi:hypothetical protein